MSNQEETIEDLLDAYEDKIARGEDVSVADLCRDHPELADEVLVRINKLRELNTFLAGSIDYDIPSVDATPAWTNIRDGPLPGGRFRPESFHARGALGEVFVAQDEELDRKVALKRLNPQQGRYEENCRRFETEATITGKLEHPGVVPVYGLGRDVDGLPVYAMRFVEGENMADAIQNFHVDSGQNLRRQNVAFQKLLRRFLSLCQTVAFAHSRGIIHRDIKPANVMLGKFGETLLVDWGLAKSISEQEASSVNPSESSGSFEESTFDATEMGVVKGSPAYMSPEQADGRWDLVGPQSDVYNLGATLFHLLTGRIPFDGDTKDVIRRVRSGDIVSPREVNSHVPAPLQAICLKAMRRELPDRYRDAIQLAEEIESWLADEPVTTWREPWRDRCLRWIRRHRTLVTTVFAVLLVLLSSLIVANYLLSNKNTQLADAKLEIEIALGQTERERGKAENSLKSAIEATHSMLVRMGRNDVAEIPEMQAVRREMLEDAVRFLTRFVGFEDRPDLVREQGLAYQYLGNIQVLLNKRKDAIVNYRQSIKLQQHLVDQFPNEVSYVQDLAQSWHELGRQLTLVDTTEAEQAYLKSIDLIESLEGKLIGFEIPLAEFSASLGILYKDTSEPEKAIRFLERSIDIREKSVENSKPGRDRDTFRLALATTYYNLGYFQLAQNQTTNAQATIEKALAILVAEPEDPVMRRSYKNRLYAVHNSLGIVAHDKRELDLALTYHERALQAAKEREILYPGIPSYSHDIAQSHHNIGSVHTTQQLPHNALKDYQTAVAIRRNLAKKHPNDDYIKSRFAESLGSLAHVLSWVDQPAKAEKIFRESSDVLEQLIQLHPKVIRYQSSLCANDINYGRLLRKLEKHNESLEVHQRVIDRATKILKENPNDASFKSHLLNGHGARANTLLSLKRFEEAIVNCDGVVAAAPANQREFWIAWRLPNLARIDHRRTWHDVLRLAESDSRQPAELYNMALACSIAIGTVSADRQIDANDKKCLDESFREQGFKFMENTIATGFFKNPANLNLLHSEQGFDALRNDKKWKLVLDALKER